MYIIYIMLLAQLHVGSLHVGSLLAYSRPSLFADVVSNIKLYRRECTAVNKTIISLLMTVYLRSYLCS